MQVRKILEDINNIIADIKYKDWEFCIDSIADAFELKVYFGSPCIKTSKVEKQSGRKWLISAYSTNSEIVLTVLKAILTAEEHEVRENFKYKNVNIFHPHIDVNVLVDFVNNSKPDTRG